MVRAGSLPWVILRPPTIYGPRDRENLIKVFRMVRYGVAPVFGDGSMEVSAVFAPDLADALLAAGTTDAVLGRTYYVNHPEVLTTAGMVRAIAAAMGRGVRTVGVPEWLGRGILHVTGTAAAIAGRATILNADKANEFFQAGWTGDPAPFTAATGWTAAHDLRSEFVIGVRGTVSRRLAGKENPKRQTGAIEVKAAEMKDEEGRPGGLFFMSTAKRSVNSAPLSVRMV